MTQKDMLKEGLNRSVLVTPFNRVVDVLDSINNWARKSSLWPMQFGLACCAIEMICTAASRFDIARFGAEIFRASPRQADLMIVSGTVTKKMVPMIVRLFNQMPEPKYVISMGACATAGGPFKEGYNVVSGIDEFLPVDVYVPGCPPTPEALLYGLIMLQKKIEKESIRKVRWYRKDAQTEIPVPILGPDLIDQRDVEKIKMAKVKPSQVQGKQPPKMLPAPASDSPISKIETLTLEQLTAKPFVVSKENILDVVNSLKNTPNLSYDYLSNLTAVDYSDCYEVVYNLYSTKNWTRPVTLKVRADKSNPVVPSLTSIFKGADFQEREVYDLMGVRFSGHPNLKRILMWEGFSGHPMRKDYLEPYYEESGKMFSSRWREGRHARSEEKNPWGRNVNYPEGFDVDTFKEIEYLDEPAFKGFKSEQLGTETLLVNLGPQHPSTHGVFRMKALTSGERILRLEPVLGYLHRNHEKIGERNTYIMNFPYTDRLDYICSMGNNLGYAIAVERLLGLAVPERAEYIRVIMAELTRIVNHFWAIGFLLNDLGAFFTPALYAIEERELILDLFELASGSRMMCNYIRFGGVAKELPPEFLPLARRLVDERLPRAIDRLDTYLTKNEIVMARCQGVGVLPYDMAINYSASGPMLRASGVKYDVRKAEPYSIYNRFEFDIPTFPNGDVYDRYRVRIAEMRESLRILTQALKQLPEGPVLTGKKMWSQFVKQGEVYARVENPKGELGFYIVADGTDHPYRYHIRAPGFVNLTPLGDICKDHLVADTVAILGSIDIVLGETDR